jgi:hypothetical protein
MNEGYSQRTERGPHIEAYDQKKLKETIVGWSDNQGRLVGPLSLDEVVTAMAYNSEARSLGRALLSGDGEAWERDREVADTMRERIAWAIVEKLSHKE